MLTDDLRSILSKYGIDASASLLNNAPGASYAKQHKCKRDLALIRY